MTSLHSRTTKRALCPIVAISQFFGLFPIQNDGKFEWRSLRFVYSLTISCSLCIQAVLHVNVFNVWCAMISLYFLWLATRWLTIVKLWSQIDANMQRLYGFPSYLRLKLNLLTFAIIGAGAVEHALAFLFALHNNNYKNIEDYFQRSYYYYFRYIPYYAVIGFLFQLIVLMSTFIWNYMDLFIMLVSTALVERFVQFKHRIQHLVNNKAENYNLWESAREDYNRLSNLTKILDQALGYLILLSYTINLFIILIQLLHTLDTTSSGGNLISKVYFAYSFGFLIIRTVLVSLLAARVYTESSAPADLLMQLPSEIYNVEIDRLIMQIKMDPCYLSGRDYFKVTKSLILGMAGAIVSYELILIQFAGEKIRAA